MFTATFQHFCRFCLDDVSPLPRYSCEPLGKILQKQNPLKNNRKDNREEIHQDQKKKVKYAVFKKKKEERNLWNLKKGKANNSEIHGGGAEVVSQSFP